MPVLRRKKSRKKLVWGIALGVLAVAALASFFLLRGRVSMSAEERELLDLINQKRANNRIDQVRPNAALSEVARRHSRYMCDVQRPELPTVARLEEELQSARYPFETWGILIDRASNCTPQIIFDAWTSNEETTGAERTGEVKSIYHQEVGISIMQDPNDPMVQWVTVVFGKKK